MGQPLSPTFANIFYAFMKRSGFQAVLLILNQFFIAAILTIPFLYLNTVLMSLSF